MYDAVYAAKAAQALWNVNTNDTMIRCLAGIHCIAAQVMSIKWTHTPSHDGHPWNELADGGAEAAAKMRFWMSDPFPGHE